jgi:radical SAM protein with 4Fe4S-binding SPASM domain
VLGIQADGGIKGCLSLQARWGDSDPFLEGSLRDDRLADIWFRPGAFAYNREQGEEALTGACGTCEHKRVCRGGAKCMAAAAGHVLTENPFCYHAVSNAEAARRRRAPLGAGAAAAAALFAIGVAPACSGPETPQQIEPRPDPDDVAEYAVEPEPDDVSEYAVMVEPDMADEYGVAPEPDRASEYAVEPEPRPDVQAEYAVQEPEPEIQAEYAVHRH